jgi:hypothetical protein
VEKMECPVITSGETKLLSAAIKGSGVSCGSRRQSERVQGPDTVETADTDGNTNAVGGKD